MIIENQCIEYSQHTLLKRRKTKKGIFPLFCFVETGSHSITQTQPETHLCTKLSLNLRASCLNLLCAGSVGMYHHTWQYSWLIKTLFHYKYHLTENLRLFVALSMHINPPRPSITFWDKASKMPQNNFLDKWSSSSEAAPKLPQPPGRQ